MGQLTAILVGDRSLGLVSGRKTPGGVELLRASRAALPEEFAHQTPEQRAESVRNAITALGGAERKIALVVPRSSAVVREFDLPAAEPEELQQMVGFQLERELPMPLDQVKYAYSVTPAGDAKVRITAVAVFNEQINGWIQLFRESGCTVTSVYVSSFGLATLAPAVAEGGTALVSISGQTAEILILDGNSLAFSRSAPIHDGAGADVLANEVERSILSYASKNAGRSVPNVIIAGEGGDADRLCAGLSTAMGRKVTRLALNGDVTRRPDVSVAMETAPAAGVVVGVLRGKGLLPDVLLPHIMKKRFQLAAPHRIGILAGLIVVLLLAWAQSSNASLQKENNALTADLARLKKPYEDVVKLEDNAKLIGKWTEGQRHTWLRTLLKIQSRIDPKQIYLQSLTLDDAGLLTMQGKCTGNEAVNDAIGELTKDKLVVADQTKASFSKVTNATTNYKATFTVTATLVGFEKEARGVRR